MQSLLNFPEEGISHSSPPTLLLGLGNCLLKDDGVGVHVARWFRETAHPGVVALEVGTDVFGALPWLENLPRALAIDALDLGGNPGDIFCFQADEVHSLDPAVLHEMGVLSVLEFVPREQWPEVMILGVQPAEINHGLELSRPLRIAMPRIIHNAMDMLALPGQAAEAHPGRMFRHR